MLDIVLILEQDCQDLDGRLQVQHIGSSPTLDPGDSDTRLDGWLELLEGVKRTRRIIDVHHIDWTDQSVVGSSRAKSSHPGGLYRAKSALRTLSTRSQVLTTNLLELSSPLLRASNTAADHSLPVPKPLYPLHPRAAAAAGSLLLPGL